VDINPYESPQSIPPLDDPPGEPPADVNTAVARARADTLVAFGYSKIGVGYAEVVGGLVALAFAARRGFEDDPAAWLGAVLLGLGAVDLAIGYGLARLAPWARRAQVVLSMAVIGAIAYCAVDATHLDASSRPVLTGMFLFACHFGLLGLLLSRVSQQACVHSTTLRPRHPSPDIAFHIKVIQCFVMSAVCALALLDVVWRLR